MKNAKPPGIFTGYGSCVAGILFCLILSHAGLAQIVGNDHIFPPAAAAKPFIDFDSKGFLIDGKRVFLASAGIEYARVPRELWYDRLLRIKRAGFNCVEIYTFWNYHEPREGEFDFTGDHDLDAFLKLVKQLGLYAIARVGPYYCAEWENGGYPLWLRFVPGLRVREDNPLFEKKVDRFFDTLMPVITRNQIENGGSVIMVQLENEHPLAWGTYMPNGYFRHLQAKALSLGLQVPYFFSGLHHGGNPAGYSGLLDDSTRPNPWFSTEFWAVWFNRYGSDVRVANTFERHTMQIVAHGGNGYNYYMAHGGTNFGYMNDDEDAASYDYGTAIGQAGDLRPIYFAFKRCALFANSFREILENSTDASAGYKDLVRDQQIHTTARHSKSGDIIFLDNPSHTPVPVQWVTNEGARLPAQGSLTLDAGDIFPVVHGFIINNSVSLQWAPVKILDMGTQGNLTTLIIYGKPGSPAELYFTVTGTPVITRGTGALSITQNQVALRAKFSSGDRPAEYAFTTGGIKIRILAVNEALSDRTWVLDEPGRHDIVTGPAYVGEATLSEGNLTLQTEKSWNDSIDRPVTWYGAGATRTFSAAPDPSSPRITNLPLAPWQAKTASAAAERAYDTGNWSAGDDPREMGADGDSSADAWYRTGIHVDTAGIYTLKIAKGGDRAIVFANGRVVGQGDIRQSEIALDLPAGDLTLAVFTAHDGRFKYYGYLGDLDSIQNKGLAGEAILQKGSPTVQTLSGWKFLKAAAKEDVDQGPPSPGASSGAWTDYSIGKDAFNRQVGYGWFQTIIPAPRPGATQIILNFKSVDDNAVVFVNGKKMGRYDGFDKPFAVKIERADTLTNPIVLTVFIENTTDAGGIDKPVTVHYVLPGTPIKGWKWKGGTGDPQASAGWKPLDANEPIDRPYFFRTQFTAPVYTTSGHHPIWRVITHSLGHGSVWVNGHNLGRYPEKIPVDGIYIPECWLRDGANDLVIYDEDGKKPVSVTVTAERAASRDQRIFTLTTVKE